MIQQLLDILSNDALSFFDNFILWVNFFGCIFALWFNWKASSDGIPSMRRTHFLVAGLAGMYLIGYLFLLVTDYDYLLWSSAFRGLSILVWPIVWTMPALTSRKIWKGFRKAAIARDNDNL